MFSSNVIKHFSVVLQHPRVRYAACNAVGQMCTDFGPTLQKLFHARVCSRFVVVASSYVCLNASSEVEHSLIVWWVIGSILHEVNPLSYFSFHPVLHDWCNKGRGMCYPLCGMVHIKEPLLLIDKSSLCGGSGFPFSLSEWSLTICLTPYNVPYILVDKSHS